MPRRRRLRSTPSPTPSDEAPTMAFQHHFHNRLLQQVNDINARNLELQSLLAQKDDQLASLNAQLQHTLAQPNNGHASAAVASSQQRNAGLTRQLERAQQVAASAEARLKTTSNNFNKTKADLNKQITSLQGQLKGGKNGKDQGKALWSSSTGVAPRAELGAANAEVKKLRSSLATLQRQFEAEKREAGRGGAFPAASTHKLTEVEDEDDEETISAVKQEINTTAPAPSRKSRRPSHSVQPAGSPMPALTMPKQLGKTYSHQLSTSRRSSLQSGASTVFNTTHRPKSAPSLKRPASTQDSLKPTPSKRSRSEAPIDLTNTLPSDEEATSSTPLPSSESESDNSLSCINSTSSEEELKATQEYIPHNSPIRKPSRPIDTSHLRKTFDFQAVTAHHSDGSITAYHSQEDLSDECDELWEAIHHAVSAWEESHGEHWSHEFEHAKKKISAPQCVSTKLGKKGARTQWRYGGEGKFACKKCVEEGKPCFAWNGEEFWLLPLHEGDRRWPVKEGLEIRYWLNVE